MRWHGLLLDEISRRGSSQFASSRSWVCALMRDLCVCQMSKRYSSRFVLVDLALCAILGSWTVCFIALSHTRAQVHKHICTYARIHNRMCTHLHACTCACKGFQESILRMYLVAEQILDIYLIEKCAWRNRLLSRRIFEPLFFRKACNKQCLMATTNIQLDRWLFWQLCFTWQISDIGLLSLNICNNRSLISRQIRGLFFLVMCACAQEWRCHFSSCTMIRYCVGHALYYVWAHHHLYDTHTRCMFKLLFRVL